MITGSQCRAARALIEWSREQLATAAGVDAEVVAGFERRRGEPAPADNRRLRQALEEAGALFIAEGDGFGAGVRLKFGRATTRAVKNWEGEGGRAGEDDV